MWTRSLGALARKIPARDLWPSTEGSYEPWPRPPMPMHAINQSVCGVQILCWFANNNNTKRSGLINELRLNSNFWSACGWISYLILCVCVQFWLQLQMQLPQVASSAAAAAVAVAVGCWLDWWRERSEGERFLAHRHREKQSQHRVN